MDTPSYHFTLTVLSAERKFLASHRASTPELAAQIVQRVLSSQAVGGLSIKRITEKVKAA